MGWRFTKTIVGALVAAGIGIVTALGAARSSFQPQPPSPDFTQITLWLLTGKDWLAAFIAAASGMSGGWAIWQMFQPAPATAGDVQADGAETRAIVAAESSEQKLFREEMRRYISSREASGEATVDEARKSLEVTNELAESDLDADRQITELLAQGQFEAAYDAAMAIAYGSGAEALAKAQQAAKLIAPFNRELAIAAWNRSLTLGGQDFDTLIAISRLHQAAENYAGSKLAARKALDVAKNDWERLIAIGDLGDIAVGLKQLDDAESQFGIAEQLVRNLSDSHPENWAAAANIAVMIEKRGDVAVLKEDYPAAAMLFTEQLEHCQKLIEWAPPSYLLASVAATAADKLSQAACKTGDPHAALEASAKAVAYARTANKHWPDEADASSLLAHVLETMGDAEKAASSDSLSKLNDAKLAASLYASAQESYGEALQLWKSLLEQRPTDESIRKKIEKCQTAMANSGV